MSKSRKVSVALEGLFEPCEQIIHRFDGIANYLQGLSDEALKSMTLEAFVDLEAGAITAKESAWIQVCAGIERLHRACEIEEAS